MNGTTAVEAQVVERRLECGDVVAAQVRCTDQQEAVAQGPSRFGECQPGRLVAVPTGMETTLDLEVMDRLGGRRAEDTSLVVRGRVAGTTQPSLEVANCFTALTLGQWEEVRQVDVGRNSSSSWSRAPLLLAPTSRLETSPPENTSSVGMLMTL